MVEMKTLIVGMDLTLRLILHHPLAEGTILLVEQMATEMFNKIQALLDQM
jgi:hypothetical protein